MNDMQRKGVAAAIKHFPGHGDTDVDSHTGLPRVDRDMSDIEGSDLLPFREIIAHNSPAMVMTAHIQYPQIDSTTLTGTDGTEVIVPATMSRKILNDLLRQQYNFNGVIITDALDMAGISHFFDPVQAVVETFRAGADIALMPYKTVGFDNINAFKGFIRSVANALREADYDDEEMHLSLIHI